MLIIGYWVLDKVLGFHFGCFMLDIGYSPALRDPAMRDRLLDIEYLGCFMLDIVYSPALRDSAMRDGILDIEYFGCYVGY